MGGAGETVIDRFAEAFVWNVRHGNAVGICIQLPQHSEQIGRGFCQITTRRQICSPERIRPESQPGFPGFGSVGIQWLAQECFEGGSFDGSGPQQDGVIPDKGDNRGFNPLRARAAIKDQIDLAIEIGFHMVC